MTPLHDCACAVNVSRRRDLKMVKTPNSKIEITNAAFVTCYDNCMSGQQRAAATKTMVDTSESGYCLTIYKSPVFIILSFHFCLIEHEWNSNPRNKTNSVTERIRIAPNGFYLKNEL